MALIRKFEELSAGYIGFRSEVDCGWRIGDARGRRVVHLETYGSATREKRGKVSQAVELDQASAAALVSILRRAFPGI
jgi:hypothetical protein